MIKSQKRQNQKVFSISYMMLAAALTTVSTSTVEAEQMSEIEMELHRLDVLIERLDRSVCSQLKEQLELMHNDETGGEVCDTQ